MLAGLPDTIRVGGRTKRIIKEWPEVRRGGRNYDMRHKRLLGGWWRKKQPIKGKWEWHPQFRDSAGWYHEGEARYLMNKLEQLWPLHFLAKECEWKPGSETEMKGEPNVSVVESDIEGVNV